MKEEKISLELWNKDSRIRRLGVKACDEITKFVLERTAKEIFNDIEKECKNNPVDIPNIVNYTIYQKLKNKWLK
jgi:hypothetical protein